MQDAGSRRRRYLRDPEGLDQSSTKCPSRVHVGAGRGNPSLACNGCSVTGMGCGPWSLPPELPPRHKKISSFIVISQRKEITKDHGKGPESQQPLWDINVMATKPQASLTASLLPTQSAPEFVRLVVPTCMGNPHPPTNQRGNPNKSADRFSAKQVPSALDLSPTPQTHLPFGVVGVTCKPKISLKF